MSLSPNGSTDIMWLVFAVLYSATMLAFGDPDRLPKIKAWWQRAKAARRKAQEARLRKFWVRGYNWAAGSILRGEETYDSVDSHICFCGCVSLSAESCAFDHGAAEAMRDLNRWKEAGRGGG